MRVAKWGNSLALRIPAAVVEELKLAEGDEVEIVARDRGRVEIAKTLTREEAIERLREFRGWLPADIEFDRDQANER